MSGYTQITMQRFFELNWHFIFEVCAKVLSFNKKEYNEIKNVHIGQKVCETACITARP